jgi:mycothiol synthase
MNERKSEVLRVQRVGAADETAALALTFAELEPTERARRIALLRDRSGMGPIGGLWAAYRGRRMVGAMRAQVQPGKSAFVAAPRVTPDETPETARVLLARVVESLPGEGVRLAQALLDTDQGEDAALLSAGGFQYVSDLLYLVSTTGAFPRNPPAKHLEFVAYAPERHQRLAQLIERTYAGSLDVRAIDGVRDVDDVLEGYKAGGRFDPARWLLVRHDGADVGCLLLCALAGNGAESDEWELTYLGVVPEARRRGFAVAMARHAQWLARQAGCGRLVLAVDAANAAAIGVYAAAGFVSWDRRSVFLRVF